MQNLSFIGCFTAENTTPKALGMIRWECNAPTFKFLNIASNTDLTPRACFQTRYILEKRRSLY
ncbi:hypothetical protein, partial [uncultured Nostoc sp.]